MENKEILRYKQILSGEKKTFGTNFWKENGLEKSNNVFKYLIEEKLKWDIKKVMRDFNKSVALKYKLSYPFKNYYNQSTGNLINHIYPDILKGKKLPFTDERNKKISIAQKNLSPEKRARINHGSKYNRYTKEYAKKLSDTKLGEINPQHKLKTEQVIEIKQLWTTGNYTTAILGEKFNISRQSVADIVYGRTWKHL